MGLYILTLVQTSQNRLDEVEKFVKYLNAQIMIDFRVIQYIFIDQGNHINAFDTLNPDIKFEYLKCDKCSLSHARNLALSKVRGKYIAFPDDDCWYECDTLARVFNDLVDKGYDGVSGIGLNETGVLTSTFPNKPNIISKLNMCAAISYTLFLRYDATVKFDENMGVGSMHGIGSGEESDYLLTLIDLKGYKILYDPTVIVHHPAEIDVARDEKALKKAYNYAIGDGYLYRKHNMPMWFIFMALLRPLIGICVFTCLSKFYETKRSYYRFKGRITGLMLKL